MPCVLLFSKLKEGRSRAFGKPVASCEQLLVFQFVQFEEVIRVFSGMRLRLVLSLKHERQFVVDSSLSLVCSFLVV